MTAWDPATPFDSLPPRPPSIAPPATLLVEASAAVARADETARRMPAPEMFAAAMPILEAQASSEIENIVTTNDELLREAAGVGEPTPATSEALRAGRALVAGEQQLRSRPISPAVIGLVASEILGHEAAIREGADVYIGDPVLGRRIYTPPQGVSLLRDLLGEWAEYVHDASIDPMTRMALAHYQFEAIHPFHDGNGRTGRVLNQLILIESGMLERPILYLSGTINQRKQEYYQRLLAVTAEDDWNSWLAFMLVAVRDGARVSHERAQRVQGAMASLGGLVDEHLPTGVSTRFIDALFANVYVTITDVVQRCGVSRHTASGWLHRLVDAGALAVVTSGRNKYFRNVRFHGALLGHDAGEAP